MLKLSQMMVELLNSRMVAGDFSGLVEIYVLLEDKGLFASWANQARSLHKGEEAQVRLDDVARDYLSACLTEGRPSRLREAMQVFDAAGFVAQAQEACARLPQVASAYLTTTLTDEGDLPVLLEAIFEADEVEGLSAQVAEARSQLLRLVRIPPLITFLIR